MFKTARRSPFLYNLATTALTSLVVLVSAIVMTRLLAQGLGPDQFGAYSLARRLLATVAPMTTISMGVAIPRYVAMATDERLRDHYLLGGLVLGIVPGLVILVSGLLLADQLTLVAFRSAGFRSLFVATLWLLLGYSAFVVLYAFYRGMSWMERANLWQLALVAIGPLFIAWACARIGRADLIVALSAVLMGCAALPLGLHGLRALSRLGHRLALRAPLRQLVSYGLPRVPADMALGALFAVGPFLTPYFGSLREAGYFSAGQSVLTAFESGVMAFGLVALPKLARMTADGRQEMVAKAVEDIITLVLQMGLFATIQGLLWADEIVWVLLGPQYRGAAPVMRVVFLALVPYLAYVMLRSVVDAVEVRAVNTANLFLALLVTVSVDVLVVMVGLGTLGLAAGMAIGFFTLGAATVLYLARRFRPRWQALRLGEVLLLNLGFFVIGGLAKVGLETVPSGLPVLAGVSVLVAGMAAFYVLILWRLKVGWLVELERRVPIRKVDRAS